MRATNRDTKSQDKAYQEAGSQDMASRDAAGLDNADQAEHMTREIREAAMQDTKQGAKALEDKNQVSIRHREEWRIFRRTLLHVAISDQDLEAAKIARAIADILKIYQEGERKAYGFADGEVDTGLEVGWEQD